MTSNIKQRDAVCAYSAGMYSVMNLENISKINFCLCFAQLCLVVFVLLSRTRASVGQPCVHPATGPVQEEERPDDAEGDHHRARCHWRQVLMTLSFFQCDPLHTRPLRQRNYHNFFFIAWPLGGFDLLSRDIFNHRPPEDNKRLAVSFHTALTGPLGRAVLKIPGCS